MAVYIEALWEEGEPRYWGEDSVSAFGKFVPELRGAFRKSWALLTAWKKHELPDRCAPMSMLLLYAFLGVALGRRLDHFALVVALGYHCLLRTHEMYQAQVEDLEFFIDSKTAVHLCCACGWTKVTLSD